MSSRLVWSTERVPGLVPKLLRNAVCVCGGGTLLTPFVVSREGLFYPRLALNCHKTEAGPELLMLLPPPCAEITGVYHRAYFIQCWGLDPGQAAFPAKR